MSYPRRFPLLAVVWLLLTVTGTAQAPVPPAGGTAQSVPAPAGTGKVRGVVLDGSDGVVPGVTVEATLAGRVVGTAVTDAQGSFLLDGVPPGRVTLRMALDGFETATLDVVVQAEAEALVSGVLRVASLNENVVVTAPAPRRTPEYPPLPPAEPVYEPQPISPLDLALVCGPAKPSRSPGSLATLGAHRQDAGRQLYRQGDELMIDVDSGASLSVGQNLVARRYFRATGAAGPSDKGEYTAGVVQVARVTANGVSAVVVYSCGELQQGDLLMPFVPEPLLVADPIGIPVYQDAARILFGEPGQLMGAPGRMMVIDRGLTHGVRQGQRLTLFRRARRNLVVVGNALVLSVREDSARIRVEYASDAIWFGDSAARQELSRPMTARRE